jgi:pimeloyl-ACP methyl ester carboxylesterase
VPAIFVHGVPDTSELWDPILAEVARDDVRTVRLPGFGTPVPDGFGCTKDEYAQWLAGELGAIGEPVDLVGHDWGSLLTQRIATTEPELVRTYALADGAVCGHLNWHGLAQQWATPEVGEQVMELMTPALVEPVMRENGHPDPAGCAARIDDGMKLSILKLYRSATQIGEDWDPGERGRERPGLIFWGRDDQFGKPKRGEDAASAANARFEILDGGHWAIFQHAPLTARLLETHWSAGG